MANRRSFGARTPVEVTVLAALVVTALACGGDAPSAGSPGGPISDGGPKVANADGGGTQPPPAQSDGGSVVVAPTADGGTTPVGTLSQGAQFVNRLGRNHFLMGLGPSDQRFPTSAKLDIKYTYLVGAKDPANGWPKYNSPDGQYATIRANDAAAKGAVPMFSVYELAALGDGNYTVVQNADYMKFFWADLKLLADKLKAFDKPAIVHLEPDFWGYAQQNSAGGDPAKFAAKVKINTACTDLPDDLTGLGQCAVRTLHTAPKVVVGFHASTFGAYDASGNPDGKAVGAFLRKLTNGMADFVATDVLDRDAGCFEAKPSQFDCGRGGTTGWYWDEANVKTPNFHQHQAWMSAMHAGAGVPVLLWQVPMGVPSATPGGSPNKYRDNRVSYFFAHPAELIAAGAVGVAFGPGASGQTTIDTDGGQFERLLTAYNASPTILK